MAPLNLKKDEMQHLDTLLWKKLQVLSRGIRNLERVEEPSEDQRHELVYLQQMLDVYRRIHAKTQKGAGIHGS